MIDAKGSGGLSADLPRRLDRYREAMVKSGVSALLVAGAEGIYYLTGVNSYGYFTPTGLVLGLDEAPQLVTRVNELATVAALAPGLETIPYGDGDDPAEAFGTALRRVADLRAVVGYEAAGATMTIDVWERLREAFAGCSWRDVTGDLMRVRAVKSDYEIERIRRAADLTDLAFSACVDAACAGVRQSELAACVYEALIRNGSEPPAFPPFIRSREKLERAHESWDGTALAPGDGLLIELSASVERYHAPLTRMLSVGEAPPAVGEAAAASSAGLEAIVEALIPGCALSDVYRAWKIAVDGVLGSGASGAPHCGYIVGLGFPPSWLGGARILSVHPESSIEIEEGMTLHALSWILGRKFPPVGMSDTVVVGRTSSVRLTSAPHCVVSV